MRRSLLFGVVLTIAPGIVGVANCPRNARPYDGTAESSYFADLGRGYNPQLVNNNDQGFQQNVFSLTSSNLQPFKLPDPSNVTVSRPCEAYVRLIRSGNSFSFSGVIMGNDLSRSQADLETNGSFGGRDVNFMGSLGYDITTLRSHETVIVLQYQSHLQAEALLPINIPEEMQRWWSPGFAQAVDHLHWNDSTDRTYQQLINGFGTHVVIRVALGASIARLADMDYCEYHRLAQFSVSAKAASDDTVKDMSAQAKFDLGISKMVAIKQKFAIRLRKSGGDDMAYLKTGDPDQYIAGPAAQRQTAVVDQGTRILEISELLPKSDKRHFLLKKAISDRLRSLLTESPNVQCGTGNLSRISVFPPFLVAIFIYMLLI